MAYKALMRRALLLALVAACGGAQKPAPPPKATLAFTGVRVFDGERVIPEAVVLVDGDRISAVGPGVPVPPGVVDDVELR